MFICCGSIYGAPEALKNYSKYLTAKKDGNVTKDKNATEQTFNN